LWDKAAATLLEALRPSDDSFEGLSRHGQMISNKRILRQENGVVLIETAFRGAINGNPSKTTYSVSSKSSPRILSFDNLASATEYFEAELTRYERPTRFTASAWRISG
jgi:hypothetical protein